MTDRRRALVVAGLVALALLGLGEAAPAALPIHVSIEGHGTALQVTVDGRTHALTTLVGPSWYGVSFEQPGPLEREYQVDGSDTTSATDRQTQVIRPLLGSPLYWFDSWLRDESSLSRWEHIQVVDLATGQGIPISTGPGVGVGRGTGQSAPGDQDAGAASVDLSTGVALGGQDAGAAGGLRAGQAVASDLTTSRVLRLDGVLPRDFQIQATLRRPEAPARLWLLGATGDRREGLELDRDRRNARWLLVRGGATEALPRWFFPEQPGPFGAELLNLVGRGATAGFGLTLATLGIARLARFAEHRAPPFLGRLVWAGTTQDVVLAGWLLAAAMVSVSLYHQLPHVLDAVSYVSQASLLAGGRIALDAGSLSLPLTLALRGPFEVVWQGRLFSQYPPGAPAFYALGQLLSLEWLVGPLACLGLIVATRWTAATLWGPACGLVVLGLGVLSPFVLFQAGSYLSHPIAGGLLAGALATFVAGERGGRQRWYAACGLLLGASLVTREAASVLFAVPLAARLLTTRAWRPSACVVACGAPFVVLLVAYNAALTGSPWLLPRTAFDPADHFGFGDGIGFLTRHTLAAGLANADELLTLLQFDLFGWPPLFALGLIGLPFLLGRARAWDVVAGGGLVVFVVAYVAYFYHGIALGPRYYFEAMPWLLLLTGRGVQVLAQVARSRLAAGVVLGLLSLNTVLFYLPAELGRRKDYSALPLDRRVSLDFVRTGLFGPRLDVGASPALVVTEDWWLFNAGLAALNCQRVPECEVLFVLAPSAEDVTRLRGEFPERTVLRTVDRSGRIGLVPVSASSP